jgi:choline dehydrogenase
MIYMRGQARDYDHWAEVTGDDSWRWQACLSDFMRHEHHWRLDPEVATTPQAGDAAFRALHGHGGEWRVEKQRLRWDILDAFAEAAVQAGIPRRDDFNTGDNEGVGYFEVNQKRGLRWNTAKAFLRPTCYGRNNFEMWTGVQVERLLLEPGDDGRLVCKGAKVRTPHGMETVRARREVILSAGAIGSVQILQLSGIGAVEDLQAAGITPRHVLPGVGRNLQDHLQIRAVFKVQGTRTLNRLASTWWGKAAIGLEYLFKQSGPMSMAPSQLGAFTRSDPGQPAANLEYHVQPLSLDAFGEPLHSFDAFTASVCNLNPESRGTVKVKSPNAEDAPLIAPNYLSTEQDRRIAAESLRLTRRIAAQPALAPYAPEEFRPGRQFQTDEELARLAGDIGTTIFHPVGTTRMGRADDEMAVVDAHLRVRGIAGLRVVDAGVMPTITSGNTNSPTLMLAEKAADWILQGA